MSETVDTFTSTGAKFFAHQEAMRQLANQQGQPIVTHLMPTDRCNHTCAFCSVETRDGRVLSFGAMMGYLSMLKSFGLKAVIISGGGNPILYRCPDTGKDFNDLARAIHEKGLEIGLITNGMPLHEVNGRRTWKWVDPDVLDLCAWIRISMSGLDHKENEVFIPDIDQDKTTLGFSYVYHDIYEDPTNENHGKVSTVRDLGVSFDERLVRRADDRFDVIRSQIGEVVESCQPAYVRLLPNCLEPSLIDRRVETLQRMADEIDPNVVFVQYKPPSAPKACYLGYIHPVFNSDGYVYPCDSCVLNETADHKFANPWRICHWTEIERLYTDGVRSLIKDPSSQCPGCVFPKSNAILARVVEDCVVQPAPTGEITHVNFV